MLVLSRKQGESIIIGSDIVVTVLDIRPDHIRLGIDAPRSISVHREEIYIEVTRENAAEVATADAESPGFGREPRPGEGTPGEGTGTPSA